MELFNSVRRGYGMKRQFVILLTFVLFLFGFSRPQATELNDIVADNDDLSSFCSVLATFSTDLIPADADNPIISPLGLYINLSMMAETVGPAVKNEILTMLGFESIADVRDLNKAVMTAFTDDSLAKEFRLKNFLFRDQNKKNNGYYNEELISEMIPHYSLEDVILDLYNEGPRRISQTIKDATNDFLEVPESEIAENLDETFSVNVLLNVIYFNDEWSQKFKRSEIKDIEFVGKSGESKTIKGLIGERVGMYFENEYCALGTLEFNKGCQIYFILPHADKTISEVLASGIIDDIVNFRLDYDSAEIDYRIPKFDIKYNYDMTEALVAKGLGSVFTKHSDSPFYPDRNFYYYKLKQNSRIVLDEEGVKAATATLAFGCGAKMDPPRIKAFLHLERPFIYLIATPQNIILFAGVINKF